jgi:hypothetical protein
MTINPKFNHKISIIINVLGLSCLGGAIFLQILVFLNIASQGYFMAIETNTYILSLEIALTAFTVAYFAYSYVKTLFSNPNE